MAEMRVIIEGTYGNVPLPVVSAASTPGAAEFVKITDGVSTASLSSNGLTGNAISTQSGFVLSGVTLNSVSANTTGTAVDGGSARSNWTAFAFPTGTLTGTLTLELSDDGGNFIPSTSVASIVAATNVGVFSTGRPSRYARVNLSGVAGAGTVLVRLMAAG